MATSWLEQAFVRLVGPSPLWQVGRRYFPGPSGQPALAVQGTGSQESMRRLSQPEALFVVELRPLTLAPVK